MTGNNREIDQIRASIEQIGNEILHTQRMLDDFVVSFMQEYRDKAIDNQAQIGELMAMHGYLLADQEVKRLEAISKSIKTEKERNEVLRTAIELEGNLIDTQGQRVDSLKQTEALSESIKIEEKRNEVLEEGIELESDLIDTQDRRVDSLKQIGRATLNAFNSISGSILQIRRNEAREKKALINSELEHTLSALNREREERLIAAGFAVANNAQSLKAQLEAAKQTGDQALAYQLQRRIKEQEINDEFDRLAEEANREAAKKKARLEYEIARQEHAMKIINAISAAAVAIIQAWRAGPILGPIFAGLTGAATAMQIAAIRSNAPRMPSFSAGGIVPGNSFGGDRILAGLNSREMVLTQQQQQNLFDAIRGNQLTQNPASVRAVIVVQMDSKEIAKSTVDIVNDGHYTIKARSVR